MNKETRNTFIIAGIVIFVFIGPAFGVLDQDTAMKIGGLLGALGGLIHGFTWAQKRRKTKEGVHSG